MAEAYSIGLLVLLATALRSDAMLSADRITVYSKGLPIEETVVFDTNSNVILSNVVPKQTDQLSVCEMSNLHDFNNGILGMKSITDGVCFVAELRETYAEIKDVVQRIKQGEKFNLLDWFVRVNSTIIPTKDIKSIAGDKIAEFCEGFPAYWMTSHGSMLPLTGELLHSRTATGELKHSSNTHAELLPIRRRRAAACLSVCVICRARPMS